MRHWGMRVRECVLLFAVVLIGCLPCFAQANLPSDEKMAAQATPENIQLWLQSKDPRLIAWGAWFASEHNDVAALQTAAATLGGLLLQEPVGALVSNNDTHDAEAIVLDALIQHRVTLSPDLLVYVSRNFPTQAILLGSMLPQSESIKAFSSLWGKNPRFEWVYAAFLAKAPPQWFAAQMLRDSEEVLFIDVTSERDGGWFLGPGSIGYCGDLLEGPRKRFWPPIYAYWIEENQIGNYPFLIDAGGERITFRSGIPGGNPGSCLSEVNGLDDEKRHRLIAEMLGIPDSKMTWQAQRQVSAFNEPDELHKTIGTAVQEETVKLQETVNEFRRRNLITENQAQYSVPRLTVQIRYPPAGMH